MQRELLNTAESLPNGSIHTGEHPLANLRSLSRVVRYHRGQEICAPGQRASDLYRVVSGAAGRCVSHPEGRRQIIDLLLPGDYFGFSTHEEPDFALEAVTECTLLAVYPFQNVKQAAEADPRIADGLQHMTAEGMARLEAQLLLLGKTTAVEKVGSFLLEMADRLEGGEDGNFILPMSRYDIADYLAISVETVSRSLTDLKNCGAIALKGSRGVRIVDRQALESTDGGSSRLPN